MGTRADFYIGLGKDADWLGSVAMDGYMWEEEVQKSVTADRVAAARTPEDFRAAVSAMLHTRGDATMPEQGWPWPWNDSRTTDYAYCFHDGTLHVFSFGSPANGDDDGERAEFPNMKDRQNVAWGARSGSIVVGDHI